MSSPDDPIAPSETSKKSPAVFLRGYQDQTQHIYNLYKEVLRDEKERP